LKLLYKLSRQYEISISDANSLFDYLMSDGAVYSVTSSSYFYCCCCPL